MLAPAQYRYDVQDRRLHVTLPDGATRTFSYNDRGQVTAEQDELGQVIRYEYDDKPVSYTHLTLPTSDLV